MQVTRLFKADSGSMSMVASTLVVAMLIRAGWSDQMGHTLAQAPGVGWSLLLAVLAYLAVLAQKLGHSVPVVRRVRRDGAARKLAWVGLSFAVVLAARGLLQVEFFEALQAF